MRHGGEYSGRGSELACGAPGCCSPVEPAEIVADSYETVGAGYLSGSA